MDETYQVGDVSVLPTRLDVPGVGSIPVNSFVIHSPQPVLVDCGLAVDEPEFLAALASVIDPAELRWIWLTHDDADHTGNLPAVMALAPEARLATHGLGALRMRTWWPIPLERVLALTPGDRLDVGDRDLVALRPPTFDNPMSLGIFDARTETLFSVDSFGAILSSVPTDATDIPEEELVGGMTAWTTFDSPWSHLTDRARFRAVLEDVRRLAPARVLGSHLPPATGCLDLFLRIIESVPDAEPFVAPDAAAFAEITALLGST